MRVIEADVNEKLASGIEAQLKILDTRAVSELVSELREARTFGYDYINLAVLERGLLAAAALQGLTGALSVEEAVQLLAERGIEDEDRIAELERGNDELAKNLEKAESEVDDLKTRPAGDQKDVFIIEEPRITKIRDTLTEAGEVLTKVPGKRGLAQKAIYNARVLAEMETTVVVIVPEDQIEF